MKNTRHKYLLISALSFLFVQAALAQPAYKKIAYNAYVSGDMRVWANIIYTIELKNSRLTPDQELDLLDYYYGYTQHLLSTKQYEQAQTYITRADRLIAHVLSKLPGNATAYSYKGAFAGFKITINKLKSISLSSESNASIDKALEIDSVNIQATIDKGNLLFHTPAIFGGNKQQALELFLKAKKLLETTNKTQQNWLYLNVLKLAARSCEKLNQPQQAKELYDCLAHTEPRLRPKQYTTN
ncbi:MAG TPA: hypothetical protein VK152_09850 [Paludibacter sp.]|nr:hypothetical protein [Paludibacter sp.]